MRSSTFLAFHRYSNSLCACRGKWVEGKKNKSEKGRGRLWLAPLSWRGSTNHSHCQPETLGLKQSRSQKNKNEQFLNIFRHSLHIHERRLAGVLAHTDRGSHYCARSTCMIILHKTHRMPAEESCGCEIPLKGHRLINGWI